MIDNYLLLATLIIIFTLLIFYWLNHKYHKYNKFQSYIKVMTAVGTIILAFGLVSQLVYYRDEKNKFTSQTISNFEKEFTFSIISLFMDHPEMNYFYEEIFFNKVNSQQKRNNILEGQICLSIFAKIVEQLAVIDVYMNYPETENINNILKKYSKILFKSSRVRFYYTNLYKPNFGGKLMIEFIQTNFGL